MLLRCVQQQLNKEEQKLNVVIKERLPDKNKLVASVLSGFRETQTTVSDVRKILHDKALNNDEKVGELYKIVPEQTVHLLSVQASNDAEKLQGQLTHEENKGDEFDILTTLSRKLQNRVADIIRYLEF